MRSSRVYVGGRSIDVAIRDRCPRGWAAFNCFLSLGIVHDGDELFGRLGAILEVAPDSVLVTHAEYLRALQAGELGRPAQPAYPLYPGGMHVGHVLLHPPGAERVAEAKLRLQRADGVG